MTPPSTPQFSKSKLQAMVAEATADCYNESEKTTGFYTMIDEHLDLPCEVVIGGAPMTLERIKVTEDDTIEAVCASGRHRQNTSVLELKFVAPLPAGYEWVEAYRLWKNTPAGQA
ncbi:hypothetical protein OH491_10760 [Termitidicoccus mucosus]|uniref:Uncharacterized protein n=1 Tax=Termitidicoccus mucosus TaxID=1184151 RepID=A0A178IEZ2_9BACT|nr:hypothetical protein AW736_16595 [Opitutaceae bacterium TSB47]